jgi:hypothetical protein
MFFHHKYEKYSLIVKPKFTNSGKIETYVRLLDTHGKGIAEANLFSLGKYHFNGLMEPRIFISQNGQYIAFAFNPDLLRQEHYEDANSDVYPNDVDDGWIQMEVKEIVYKPKKG